MPLGLSRSEGISIPVEACICTFSHAGLALFQKRASQATPTIHHDIPCQLALTPKPCNHAP